MKHIKSNGRYKYYNLGFHHIVDFAWVSRTDRELFAKLASVFKDMYGPDKVKTYENDNAWGRWVWNEHWRLEQNANAKRRRIYLKEESGLILALLKVNS